MKVREVLVKVFEPGRLQRAWQQVRKNAGACQIASAWPESITCMLRPTVPCSVSSEPCSKSLVSEIRIA